MGRFLGLLSCHSASPSVGALVCRAVESRRSATLVIVSSLLSVSVAANVLLGVDESLAYALAATHLKTSRYVNAPALGDDAPAALFLIRVVGAVAATLGVGDELAHPVVQDSQYRRRVNAAWFAAAMLLPYLVDLGAATGQVMKRLSVRVA